MIINKVLNTLFSTWSNIVVMRALENYAVGISGREVARIAGLTPKNCLITLSMLEELGIVKRVRGGREHLFTLNREHFLVNEILIPVLAAERKYVELISKEISRSLRKHTISVYVFGSVVRKEETIDSDYDICILYNTETNKKKIEERLTQLSTRLKKKFGVSLAPFYITKIEFAKRAKAGKSPVKDIIKEGIHISGLKIKELLHG
jgi:predicted nucleotidyltransferase